MMVGADLRVGLLGSIAIVPPSCILPPPRPVGHRLPVPPLYFFSVTLAVLHQVVCVYLENYSSVEQPVRLIEPRPCRSTCGSGATIATA